MAGLEHVSRQSTCLLSDDEASFEVPDDLSEDSLSSADSEEFDDTCCCQGYVDACAATTDTLETLPPHEPGHVQGKVSEKLGAGVLTQDCLPPLIEGALPADQLHWSQLACSRISEQGESESDSDGSEAEGAAVLTVEDADTGDEGDCGRAAGPVARPKAKQESVEGASPACPLVIFDWDDTLLPTHFVEERIEGPRRSSGVGRFALVGEDSPHFEKLKAHAQRVRTLLETAASHADVAIVTLATRSWFDESAEAYLPGLDLPELLERLQIPVYCAREYLSNRELKAALAEEGLNPGVIAKRNAMKHCLKKFVPAWRRDGANVLSVGDSETELCAIKELLWQDDLGRSLCKTFKFVSDPTLEFLGMEVETAACWLGRMIKATMDFHVDIEELVEEAFWDA